MDWLHKMKRVWVAVSARIRSHKSGGAVGPLGGSGDANASDYGLLKLRDDVRMCGYQDVQVMWNMLSGSQPECQKAVSAEAIVTRPLKRNKQRQPSWRVFFWTYHRDTSSSSSSSSSLFS